MPNEHAKSLIELLEPEVPALAAKLNDLLTWHSNGDATISEANAVAFNVVVAKTLFALGERPPEGISRWAHSSRCHLAAAAYAHDPEVQAKFYLELGPKIRDACYLQCIELAEFPAAGTA